MSREVLTAPWRWAFFVFVMAAFLVVLYGADRGRRHMSNRVVDWLPEGFEETRDFSWFLKHFYEGELLMASWDDCAPDDPRLDEIARRLTSPDSSGRPAYYWKVMTTASVFRELIADPLNLTEEEAYERMRGWIISQDFSQGCLVAFLSEEGYKDQHAAIKEIRAVTDEVSGLPDGGVRIAGPSLDSVAIDDASNSSQKTLLPIFLIVCILMLFLLLKAWSAVFVIFMAAIFNEEMSAALIYYTGTNMDSISLLCASLLFVLTISGGLHLLNYYRDNLQRSGKEGAAAGALKKAALPCGLACLTTVLGLYSLAISQVVPIRHFGQFATAALILGTVFFFLYISVFVEQFPIRSWLRPDAEDKRLPSYGRPPGRLSIENAWNWFPGIVIRNHYFLTVFNLTLLALFAYSLPKLETTVTFHGMFRPDAPVIQDYDYLESRFGGLVPVEVVVSIPNDANPSTQPLQSLGLLERIEQALCEIDGVESALSALTFVPYLPDADAGGLRAASARSVFNKMVKGQFDALKAGCLYDDRTLPEDEQRSLAPAERWRISLRVCAKSNIAYGPFLEKIGKKVNQIVAENEEALGLNKVTSLITGGVPVVHKAQKQLLKDLTNSYISAFGLILLTLIVLFRGLRAGLLAMIPNLFPSVLVFGAMALMRRPIDMGTMMTASVALGISVDGTIHFLTWYRQGLSAGLTQEEAVRFGYRECGTAMVQATLICGGGMLVFAFSHFVPISRFAWMLSILLLIALYGDLVLFPALLVGSLGRCFYPSRIRKKKPLNADRNVFDHKNKLEESDAA